MSNVKKKSVDMAKKKGHVIELMHDSWAILRENAPDNIHPEVWNCFIDYWDTPSWKNKSLIAKRNRASTDESGVTARHTGGSIGVAETRKKMKKFTGKEPAWEDLFMKTRLTAESKTKYFNEDVEGLTFITPTAGRAHIRGI